MPRGISAVAAVAWALLCMSPAPARAQDDGHAVHNKGGIGFHDNNAPLGVRWWLANQRVGIDLGFGFESDPPPSYPDEKVTGWTIDVGVPIVLRSWPRVHVLFRPGLNYQSRQVEVTSPPVPLDTENQKFMTISGEIEAEAFLLQNFSVSASTGIRFESFDPAGAGDKENSFMTFGRDFTTVGFHAYLFQ